MYLKQGLIIPLIHSLLWEEIDSGRVDIAADLVKILSLSSRGISSLKKLLSPVKPACFGRSIEMMYWICQVKW